MDDGRSGFYGVGMIGSEHILFIHFRASIWEFSINLRLLRNLVIQFIDIDLVVENWLQFWHMILLFSN